MPAPITLSWPEAERRYAFQQHLQAWNDRAPVHVWTGDTHLDVLDLDEDNVIVAGNLTLTDELTSFDGSGALVIFGDLRARNVLSGGGQIIVRGNATIQNGVLADYNHGSIWVTGNLRAGIVIAEHELRVDGTLSGRTIDLGGFRVAAPFTPDIPRNRAVYEARQLFVPDVLSPEGYIVGGALAERLRDGLPLLLDASA